MSESSAERWQPRTLTSVPVDAKSLEEVAEQARQKGYADGLAQGQVEARKQGEATASELAALWHSMQRPMAHQDKEVSEHLLSLVVSISTAVLRRELFTDAGAIKTALDDALNHLAECDAPLAITLCNENSGAFADSLADSSGSRRCCSTASIRAGNASMQSWRISLKLCAVRSSRYHPDNGKLRSRLVSRAVRHFTRSSFHSVSSG